MRPPPLNRLRELMRRIEEEKGPFALFGLFGVMASPGRWRLVAAAPWFPDDDFEAREYLRTQVRKAFRGTRPSWFYGVLILKEASAAFDAIIMDVGEVDGIVERRARDLFGFEYFLGLREISQAVVFRARRTAVSAVKPAVPRRRAISPRASKTTRRKPRTANA
jgi:hypothetical protein